MKSTKLGHWAKSVWGDKMTILLMAVVAIIATTVQAWLLWEATKRASVKESNYKQFKLTKNTTVDFLNDLRSAFTKHRWVEFSFVNLRAEITFEYFELTICVLGLGIMITIYKNELEDDDGPTLHMFT